MNLQSPYLRLIIATLIWGGNFVIGRAVSDQLPPFVLSFCRWCTALLVLLPFAWRKLVSEKRVLQKNWLAILLMSLTGIAGFNTLLYIALHYTTSINASLVFSTSPIVIALLSLVLIKESLNKNLILGAFISVIGVIYIISQGSLATFTSLTFNPGDMIMITAVLAWGLYAIIVRKYKELPAYSLLVSTIVTGIFILSPFFIWEMFYSGKEIIWSVSSILAVLYVGIFASIAAFILWNSAVIQLGPAKASIFLNLITVFAAIFAILFNNESLFWYQVLGGVLVIIGVRLSTKVS